MYVVAFVEMRKAIASRVEAIGLRFEAIAMRAAKSGKICGQ